MTNDSDSQLLSRSLEYVVLESLICMILSVSAIAGNVLVLVAVYRNPRLRKVCNVYIVCLALTDLFMGVFVFPIIDATLISGKFPGGQDLCLFQAILSSFLLMTSIQTMVMIAVQRYYKIVRPSKYRSIFTHRFMALTIALIWSTMLLPAVLFAVRRNGVHFYQELAMCMVGTDNIAINIGFYFFGVLLPFLVMSSLYFKIWRFIKSHNVQMSHSNVNTEEVKLTKSLFIVLGAFAACYIPLCIAVGNLEFKVVVPLPRQLYFFSFCMFAFTSVVNPIIYGVMNREFRKEFAKIVCYPSKVRVIAEVEPVS